MELDKIRKNLESIYSDYYDGLYTDAQLKLMLKKLHGESNLDISKWSELILDAQWKYASEEDYEQKRIELELEYINKHSEGAGIMFFCNCGGVLLIESIEKYPDVLNSEEKMNYDRKCKAKCVECGNEYENLKYD